MLWTGPQLNAVYWRWLQERANDQSSHPRSTRIYDSVNYKVFAQKAHFQTKHHTLTKFIRCTPQDRSFSLALQDKNSRWKTQKNGLAQESMLEQMLFNISYTNDQPVNSYMRNLIYTDDTAEAAPERTFEKVEDKLTRTPEGLAVNYKINDLRLNPSESQVCSFHLGNRRATRKLRVSWQRQEFEHRDTQKYLGVKLNRALTFKHHCQNTKNKVQARDNILRKLIGSSWGVHLHVQRKSRLKHYACMRHNERQHTKKIESNIFDMLISIVSLDTWKQHPYKKMNPIIGIEIRRNVAKKIYKKKKWFW